MNNGRIVSLDAARTLCAVWIVCVWHMNQYLVTDIKLVGVGDDRLPFLMVTNGVLALFTFISGYFASQKEINKIQDALSFYRKRVLRFGIPLLISCIFLTGGGNFLPLHIITTTLGISQFLLPPYPKTLWYFSMIIAFYYVTPLLCYAKRKKQFSCAVLSLTIFLFLYIGNLYLGFDYRLHENFIFYAVPFICPCKYLINILQSKWAYIIFLVSLTAELFFYKNAIDSITDLMVVSDLLVCLGILSLASVLATVPRLPVVFYYLSYASMFAYLYHRELYIVATKIIGKFNYCEAAFFGILLFVLSYYGQQIYDKTINKKSK